MASRKAMPALNEDLLPDGPDRGGQEGLSDPGIQLVASARPVTAFLR